MAQRRKLLVQGFIVSSGTETPPSSVSLQKLLPGAIQGLSACPFPWLVFLRCWGYHFLWPPKTPATHQLFQNLSREVTSLSLILPLMHLCLSCFQSQPCYKPILPSELWSRVALGKESLKDRKQPRYFTHRGRDQTSLRITRC